jgi:hypothetical protein
MIHNLSRRTDALREALNQTAVFGAISLVAIAGTIALLWRASDIWAATHGYGTPGTWTATHQDPGSRSMVRWYGDFTPYRDGPVRHDVPMEGYVDPVHGRGTVAAVYRSGTAYSVPGSGQWLAAKCHPIANTTALRATGGLEHATPDGTRTRVTARRP